MTPTRRSARPVGAAGVVVRGGVTSYALRGPVEEFGW